jgi:tRNA threonylcarbamoyladenosine biosynthesis protein TsaE
VKDPSTTPSPDAAATPLDQAGEHYYSSTPQMTFEYGRALSKDLAAGDLILLSGGLGAGKTLLTKGIVGGLGYDVDEVTSPSFALVNLYKTDRFDVFHIDLWRTDAGRGSVEAVGLDEILETPNAITIVEWAERLGNIRFTNRTIRVILTGDGDEPRQISVRMPEDNGSKI